MEKITWVYDDITIPSHIDFTDKNQVTRNLIETMLQRTNSMFKWTGLPDTIPESNLELLLQTNGYAGIIKKDDKLFAVRGFTGGVRNYNYEPTTLIVSNPYLLTQSEAYEIYYGKDSEVPNPIEDNLKKAGKCVVIKNDALYNGILPICGYYASQLTENTITKRRLSINMRTMYIFAASDGDVKEDFDDCMMSLEKGEASTVIVDETADLISNGIKSLPFSDSSRNVLTDLIENEQYIKASWLNDLGLQANYNMKRESINSNESQLNKDAVLPLVDTMLALRKLACSRINELFGTNIDVEFNSAWGYTRKTIEEAINAIDESDDTKVSDPATQVASENEANDATQVAPKEDIKDE